MPKHGFVIAPFNLESKAQNLKKQRLYGSFKQYLKTGMSRFPPGVTMPRLLETMGIAERRKYGTVIDLDALTTIAYHPAGDEAFKYLYSMQTMVDPKRVRDSHREALKVVHQLISMGHEVHVQDSGKPSQAGFVRMSRRMGAKVETVPRHVVEDRDVMAEIQPSMVWARDQYLKIGGKKERPRSDMESLMYAPESHFFGEGGQIVQVGPKQYAISELLTEDPRVREYERKGYDFHPMPIGHMHELVLSDVMGAKMYTTNSHIDMVLGGVPEKGVVAVDPHYLADHRLSIEMMRDKYKLKVVEVPKEEADRHPANFLPLGDGRVLVDSGAPKFIKRLEDAGVEVVPTKAPIDSLIVSKGGLHCMFNEL